jgi:hypothetical protein
MITKIKESWHDRLPLLSQKCIECGKKFKSWRKRMYCSASCSTAVQTRKFRKKRLEKVATPATQSKRKKAK